MNYLYFSLRVNEKKKEFLYGESVRYCIFDTTKLRHYSQLFDIAGKFVLLAE